MKTIEINRCTQEELEWLPGVGPATAEKIIKARPIEAVTELEQLVPPSAWLKIQEAEAEFAFGVDGEEPLTEEEKALMSEERQKMVEALQAALEIPGNLTADKVVQIKAKWQELWPEISWSEIPILKGLPEEPPIILQEPEPMTLRRVLPGQELKVGAEYLCIWNMQWGPDGQAVMPTDAPTQLEIEGWFNEHDMGITFAHYGASVRLYTRNRGLVPLVLFEIVKEKEEAEDAEEETGNHQRNGQGD